MSLEAAWFSIIAALWSGFVFLEGFDFGAGMLQFFLGKNEGERGTYIYAIGPHWGANEVWLLCAGGAMFVAFPPWYAAVASSLYLPFAFLLIALVTRGVCFEFRHRLSSKKLRACCDAALMASSFAAAVLVGAALANLAIGIPVDASGKFIGSFFDIVKPSTLLAGLFLAALSVSIGALFLALKIEGELYERVCKASRMLSLIAALLYTAAAIPLLSSTPLYLIPWALSFAAAALVFRKRFALAFASLGLCMALSVAALFFQMFPNALVAINPENSLDIASAASSQYTLEIMGTIAAVFIPLALICQALSYFAFRKRISPRNAHAEA